jgi:hypothetical protein
MQIYKNFAVFQNQGTRLPLQTKLAKKRVAEYFVNTKAYGAPGGMKPLTHMSLISLALSNEGLLRPKGCRVHRAKVCFVRSGQLSEIRKSLSVMKNDSKSVARAASQAADAVPEVDAVIAFRSFHRTIVHGEHYGITDSKLHNFRPTLHARALFGQYEFPAGKIGTGLGKKDCDLKRKRLRRPLDKPTSSCACSPIKREL